MKQTTNWLRECRMNKNYTQRELADLAGITTQHYNFIENDRRRPSPEVAKRIAAALDFGDEWYRLLESKPDTP